MAIDSRVDRREDFNIIYRSDTLESLLLPAAKKQIARDKPKSKSPVYPTAAHIIVR